MLKNIKATLTTNVVQQSVGLLVFLVLPNILAVDDFAKIVYINVLLSFSGISDLGMTLVYSRRLPGIHHRGNPSEIAEWMSSVFWFLIIASAIFAGVTGCLYYAKFSEPGIAMALLWVPVVLAVNSFQTATSTSTGDFGRYGKINIVTALGRLLGIPLAFVLGVLGWVLSTSMAGLIAIGMYREGLPPSPRNANWRLVRDHVHEGFTLGLIALLWLQLIGSGRLFASMGYAGQYLAEYGLVNTGYQIVVALLTAIHLPITVHLLKIIDHDVQGAVAFAFKVLGRSLPLTMIMVLLGAEAAPLVIETFFPKYHIQHELIYYTLYSLIFLPFMLVMGTLFVGTKKLLPYLLLLAGALIFNFGAYKLFSIVDGHLGAARAQFVSLGLFVFALLVAAFYYFSQAIENRKTKAGAIFMQYLAFGLAYLVLKWMIR